MIEPRELTILFIKNHIIIPLLTKALNVSADDIPLDLFDMAMHTLTDVLSGGPLTPDTKAHILAGVDNVLREYKGENNA